MALKFNKRVKFVYDYDWVEDDLYLSNSLKGKKELAQALTKCKPKIWDTLISQYGIEPFEVPFVQKPISSDFYKWLPWFEGKLQRDMPPLCDGALNDAQFSFKLLLADDLEAPVPEYIDISVNAYEFANVSEYYIMQCNIRRVVSEGNQVDFVTSHRVLQYTSNY